eukprot:917910-Alexandrium_andersonii.AAC.1
MDADAGEADSSAVNAAYDAVLAHPQSRFWPRLPLESRGRKSTAVQGFSLHACAEECRVRA